MKIKLILVVMLSSLVVVAGGTVITVYLTHPRDDAAYLANLHRAGTSDGWDNAFSVQTDAYFVMQAEDACAWLSDQDMALWRTEPWYELPTVAKRYGLTADEQDTDLWGSIKEAKSARETIAQYAFTDICGATYEFHRPHYLWRDPPNVAPAEAPAK
jgi:hypothetical protein